jgi:cytochrome c556
MRALIAVLTLLACAWGAEAAAMSVKDEMKQVVEPASNLLFAVGGEADPANGPDQPAVPPARWSEAAQAAHTLKAVAAALDDPARAKPGGEWSAFTRQMADASAAAETAAAAKDGAKLSQAANDLSDTCSSCHAKYKPQG